MATLTQQEKAAFKGSISDPGAAQAVIDMVTTLNQAAVVAALAQTVSASYVQAEVQAISTKVDAVIAALKAAGLMKTV